MVGRHYSYVFLAQVYWLLVLVAFCFVGLGQLIVTGAEPLAGINVSGLLVENFLLSMIAAALLGVVFDRLAKLILFAPRFGGRAFRDLRLRYAIWEVTRLEKRLAEFERAKGVSSDELLTRLIGILGSGITTMVFIVELLMMLSFFWMLSVLPDQNTWSNDDFGSGLVHLLLENTPTSLFTIFVSAMFLLCFMISTLICTGIIDMFIFSMVPYNDTYFSVTRSRLTDVKRQYSL